MPDSKKKLLVFLSHADEDKPKVRNLCERLRQDGFDPWMDEERLLPGQDWSLEIEKALQVSDAILLCFSAHSVQKEGYIQREYKRAMKFQEEKPEGKIFVIPVRLDECKMPSFIQKLHSVDFPKQYDRLVMALNQRENKSSLQLVSGIPSQTISIFPHDNWTEVNHGNWLPDTVSWFKSNYELDPSDTMNQLIDHVFHIIRNAGKTTALLTKITELGKQLQACLPDDSLGEPEYVQHRNILILLERGIHRQHSHLFMLPQISKYDLLNIENYPRLLLSTKLHAAGEYKIAQEMLQGVAGGCCLAQYVMGQSARKQGLYLQAHEYLDEGLRLLGVWQQHQCPFSKGSRIICNEHLLTAEVLRAKGVVLRKEGKHDESEQFFRRAANAADQAIQAMPADSPAPSKSELVSTNTIWADYERDSAYRVKADVLFSHGYYWYERHLYEKSRPLFSEAVKCIEITNEQWDSPYTRLAVIQLVQGHFHEAAKIFTRARTICKNTPIVRNREALLSLALCTLGLKVIEKCYSDLGFLTLDDPMKDLEHALEVEPKLTLGPLECHRDDAKHFLIDELEAGAVITEEFIHRLNKEINLIKRKQRD